MGLPFFKPLYMDSFHIRMQGCPFARIYVEKLLSRVMAPPNFPITYSELSAKIEYEKACSSKLVIDTIEVFPVPISHPNQGAGYKFVEDGRTFVFLTDNELDYPHRGGKSYEDYLEFSRGADFLIHDAEFTPAEYVKTRGWGHSIYPRVVQLGMEAGVGMLGLFHLNQDRVDDAMDALAEDARAIARRAGHGLDVFGVACDMEFTV
jgi:ribonuclease BN (tRNA processing enzyme)